MDIVFAARIGGGNRPHGPALMFSLGLSYLYVRGDCAYWVNLAPLAWLATRRGSLPNELEKQLANELGTPGLCADGVVGSGDGSVLEIYDGCLRHEGAASWQKLQTWLLRLNELAEPVTLDLRVTALYSNDPLNASDTGVQAIRIEWPYGWSLAALVADSVPDYYEGSGILLTGDRASDLYALRERYARDGALVSPSGVRTDPFTFWNGRDGAELYTVSFRDRLPFEDEKGAVPLPSR
jgi:hypothetical protein